MLQVTTGYSVHRCMLGLQLRALAPNPRRDPSKAAKAPINQLLLVDVFRSQVEVTFSPCRRMTTDEMLQQVLRLLLKMLLLLM